MKAVRGFWDIQNY